MPQTRLLYLEAQGISAWHWRAGSLEHEGEFPAGQDGHRAFAKYLAANPISDFLLLADLQDEAFHEEAIPYVRGPDRTSLLKRKLTQYFFGTPYAVAIPLGRESHGRRDERMLFAAITVPQAIDPWMGPILGQETRLAGIWSAPLLAEPLLQQLPDVPQHCVIVTQERAGLRQTFFNEGKLRFSRLTPVVQASPNAVALACSVECMRMRQYLAAQEMMPDGVALTTYVLVNRAHMNTYKAACRSNADVRYELADLPEIAHSLGLRTPITDSRADTLFLHLLARKPPLLQMAPAPERRFHTLARTRFALMGAGAIAMGACLLLSAREIYTVVTMRSDADMTRQQTAAESEKYNAVTRRFPALKVSTDTLRDTVAAYSQLEKRSALPEPLFLQVSAAMDANPAVGLERIEWLTSNKADEPGISALADSTRTTPEETDPSAAQNRPTATPRDVWQIALVHGSLPAAMAANQRGMLAQVDKFASDLARQDLQITVLRRPFETDPSQTLKSDTDTALPAEPPRFVVRVAQKL